MPRLESERSRRRRQVRLGLREGSGGGAAFGTLPARAPVDTSMAAQLFAAIDAKDAPRFGIVKLAGLDLDVLHAAPVRVQERGGPLGVWAPTITLLAYAALRRRDGIVAALLRAGADPSVRWTSAGGSNTEGVQAYVASLRVCYSVWVVRKVVEMRRAGALTAGAAAVCCHVCGAATGKELLAWDGACGHLLCETCFWRLQMAHDHVAHGGSEMQCPVCAPTAVDATIVPKFLAPASESTTTARAERKSGSMQKWLALAESKADAEKREASTKTKKTKGGGRTRALTECEAAALNPGWLRGDRVERLNEAACAGDVLRLLAIIEVGVDIDGRSECGETAAISAAMLGNPTSLRVLCWAGANLSIGDAIGATPLSAAAARGHEAVLEVLNEYCSTSVRPAATPLRALPPLVSDFRCLIDPHAHPAHPGCGSGYVDNGLSRGWLDRLHDVWAGLPAHIADTTENTSSKSYALTCAKRSLFCDTEGWVEAELAPLAEQLLMRTAATGTRVAELKVLPRMRFLHYNVPGGNMQPHVDLAKRDPASSVRLSTHTFMVHLATCQRGGETVLLSKLMGAMAAIDATSSSGEGQLPDGVLAAVRPVRGRLLIFPHMCPHAGLAVSSVPKLFLRGELLVRWEHHSARSQGCM